MILLTKFREAEIAIATALARFVATDYAQPLRLSQFILCLLNLTLACTTSIVRNLAIAFNQIMTAQRMSRKAMCLSIQQCFRNGGPFTTSQIDASCHWFKVRRVDAGAIPTEMIKIKSLRDWAVD
jgi:hypothetical protein